MFPVKKLSTDWKKIVAKQMHSSSFRPTFNITVRIAFQQYLENVVFVIIKIFFFFYDYIIIIIHTRHTFYDNGMPTPNPLL